MNNQKGFSIIEIMVVLAILAVMAMIVLPSFQTMRSSQVIKAAASDVFSALDRAKSYTLSSIDSSEYGVHFESNKIVIFKGKVYSSTDPLNTEVAIVSPASISEINLTGGAVDLYFNRLNGMPDKTGTITVSIPSISKIITISATGAVSMN